MFIIEARTVNESLFVHLASTMEKGVEWVKKNSEGWYDCREDYCFYIYGVTIDNEGPLDEKSENAMFIDIDGNLTTEHPLF